MKVTVKLRYKKLRDGSRSLYLDIYQDGKRRYEFLNIRISGKRKFKNQDDEKQQLAESIRIKRENEIRVQEKELSTKENKQRDYIEYYESFIVDIVKSHQSYYSALKKLKTFINDDTLIFREITKAFLLDFQSYLLENVSINTTSHYMTNICHSLNYAVKQKIIPQNPIDLIKENERVRYKRKEGSFLTLTELTKLVRADTKNIDNEIKQLFIFSCFTGLRWSDVSQLTYDKIQKVSDNRCVIRFTQVKTRKSEILPLPKQAQIIIDERKQESECDELVFPRTNLKYEHYRGRRLNIINRALKRWAKQAGISKNLHFHVARHTNATLHLCNGTDILTISKLLGHSDVRTTTIYTHIVNTNLINAVGNLPNFK